MLSASAISVWQDMNLSKQIHHKGTHCILLGQKAIKKQAQWSQAGSGRGCEKQRNTSENKHSCVYLYDMVTATSNP